MKEVAKLKQLPPVYTGKWASATNEEVEEELEKGTPYTYRFRVPKGSLKINDQIRGEVSSFHPFSVFTFFFSLMVQINDFNSLNVCHLHLISRNQLISWKYFISSYNFLSMILLETEG